MEGLQGGRENKRKQFWGDLNKIEALDGAVFSMSKHWIDRYFTSSFMKSMMLVHQGMNIFPIFNLKEIFDKRPPPLVTSLKKLEFV